MPDPITNNVAASIVEAMKDFYEPRKVELHGEEPFALSLPRGVTLQSVKALLDEYRARPERRRGTAKFSTLDSLIDHVNRFKSRWSAAFCIDSASPSIVAVYDYHEGNTYDDEANVSLGEPDWLQHRAHYSFPLSEEWVAWRGATEPMTQVNFAEFLEDRIADVQDPANITGKAAEYAQLLELELASPSKLLTISRGLTLRVEAKAGQTVNLTTGETQIVYEEEHREANFTPLKVPGAFAIAIPVFKNGALYSIPVRLRYRLDASRKILWWVSLSNIDRILQHAVDEACTKFRQETMIPLFHGAPEQG